MIRAMTQAVRLRAAVLAVAFMGAVALSACAPLLLGGALLGGSMVYVDRRTSGTQIDDETIELKSINRVGDVTGDRGHVSITSYDRIVLITGEVPSEADKAAVGQAMGRIDNVRSVVNELAVGPSSSLATRTNDTLITGKVKASLLDAKEVQSNAFKVVTVRGNVYLMGRVTEREATRAAEISRGIGGVRKVVRVFELVSEAELADLKPRAAPLAAPSGSSSAR